VQMTIQSATNLTYSIEASSNLADWTPLGTIYYTNGVFPYTDLTAPGETNRFYRARLLP
jgi:hypothetical protein